MSENPSPEEIVAGLRRGYCFDPRTPGLLKAARQLIRPLVAGMDGKEIVYVCRFPRLMRVNYLEVDDQGFRAVATPTHELGALVPSMENNQRSWNLKPLDPQPLDIGAHWSGLRLMGKAICVNLLTDHFYVNPALVAEVKALSTGKPAAAEIRERLERASALQ